MNLDKDKLDKLFDLPESKEEDTKLPNKTLTLSTENVESIYNELKTLVSNGNEVLNTVKYVLQSNADPELVASMASLLVAIKDTLKEFTKIHLQNIKHSQQKEIEEIRIKAKKDLLQIKIDETKKLLTKNNEKDINLIPFNQEAVITALNEINKQKQIINITPKE